MLYIRETLYVYKSNSWGFFFLPCNAIFFFILFPLMKNIFPKSIYIGTFYGTFHSFYIFDISTKPASSKK